VPWFTDAVEPVLHGYGGATHGITCNVCGAPPCNAREEPAVSVL
jgi:hypothetical protein